MTAALRISADLSLPVDFVTKSAAILAQRRKGKTYTASVIAEELVRLGLPWVAMDPTGAWWGLRSSPDGRAEGLPVVVLGGQHGDLPLARTDGRIIADLVVDQPGWYVVDFTGFESGAAERQFATAFAQRLYRRKGEPGNDFPLHLFVDEADRFVPQTVSRGKGEDRDQDAALLGAFEAIVRRGGIRGLGTTLISQRSAVVNKNVLEQIDVLIALRIVGPNDQKRIKEYLDADADGEQTKAMMGSLAQLAIGEAWVWEPGADPPLFDRVKIRERRTFNSSATPKVGEKRVEPSVFAAVDLAAVRDRLAEVIERADADDPKVLRRRIKELEDEVAGRVPREIEVKVRIPEIPAWLVPEMTDLLAAYDAAIEQVQAVRAVVHVLRDRIQVAAAEVAAGEVAALAPFRDTTGGKPVTVSYARADRGNVVVTPPTGKLGKTPRRLLGILVQQGPLTPKQLAARSCMSAKGGSFERHLTTLRAEGMIERKQPLTATDVGIAVIGDDVEPLPTGPDLFEEWCQHPKVGQGKKRAMLEALRDHGQMTKADLAAAVEMEPSGGSFERYLSALRSLDLITGDRGAPLNINPDLL